MKKPRSVHRGATLVALGSLLFQATGCAEAFTDDPRSSSELRQGSHALSDEELFREIMFPNAAVVDKIPEFARLYSSIDFETLEQSELQTMNMFQDVIAANIHQIDPDFMSHFATEMRSGDPLRVRQGLSEAGEMMVDALRMTSAELDAVTAPDRMEELASQVSTWPGPDEDILEHIENFDPEAMQDLLSMVTEQLEIIDPGYDPAVGLAVMVEAQTIDGIDNGAVDGIGVHKTTNIAVNRQAVVESYYLVAFAAAYVVAVAAVAAAVVLLTVAVPYGPNMINGESMQLFQDQLVANITVTYAV